MKLLVTILTLFAIESVSYSQDEDLGKVRPKFDKVTEAETIASGELDSVVVDLPSMEANDEIDATLDYIAETNAQYVLVRGYKILLYSGRSQGQAQNVCNQINEIYPETNIRPDWGNPTWRVEMGCYITKLEAYKELESVKELFPMALIIPANVRKSCVK